MPTPNTHLRRERQLRGWSQAYVAEQIGAPDYYISRWERGEVLPSPYYQQKLCELFGKTTEELGLLQKGEDQSPSPARKRDPITSPGVDRETFEALPKLTDEQLDRPGATPIVTSPFSHWLPPDQLVTSEEPPVESSFLPQGAGPTSPTSPESNGPVIPPAHSSIEEPIPASAHSLFGAGTTPEQHHVIPSLSAEGTSKKQRRGRILTAILMALVLLVASLGALILLTPKPPVNKDTIVGHAFFLSSQQLNSDNSQGVNDELLIDLHSIPDPAPGKAYYGWLLGDESLSEPPVIPLGQLPINHGKVSMLYSDKQHANLLLYESRFLVTEQDATVPPTTYTPDYNAWRYYAEISQAPNPKDKLHFTMLDHLRHLTADSPELRIRGLRGGLDSWFLRNTQEILEWANAARDDWNARSTDSVHRDIVRVLDYLEGAGYVQKDVPAVGPSLLARQQDVQVALLGPTPDGQDPPGYSFSDEIPPGYVYLVASHLDGAVLAPDATEGERALAAQIQMAINRVKNSLEQIHQDAKQLLMMAPDQLVQASTLSLVDDMVMQAQVAYSGQFDPVTGQTQGGVLWICNTIQGMATFEVKPYTANQA